MTLPFRRRHHDLEISHDRARAIASDALLGPVEPADAAWLQSHLEGCAECRRETEGFRVDHELLRGLRDATPEPPRDLWARTAAAIERDAGHRSGAGVGAIGRRRIGRLPLGAVSGLIVVVVVVGVSLFPRGTVPVVVPPSGTDVALGTPQLEPTLIPVTADGLAWLERSANGSYDLRLAKLDQVCPASRDGCAPLTSEMSTSIRLGRDPQTVVLSPEKTQIVVVTGSSTSAASDVLVVDVPSIKVVDPSASPDGASPSPVVTPAPPSVGPTVTPPPTDVPTVPPTLPPGVTPAPTVTVAPTPIPSDGHAIASGVVIVGDTAYSADGTWLAFSARSAVDATGPDLFIWHVGDDQATQVTSDHRTFFAGWLGDLVLASRVVPPEPTVDETGSPIPTASAPGGPTASPDSTAEPIPSGVEEHAVSFLFDPMEGEVLDTAWPDVWHPTVDPTGRFVTYWQGTLRQNAAGTGWDLATGSLVLDEWNPGVTADPDASESPETPTGAPASSEPGASPASTLPIGPAGHPVVLTEQPVAQFDTWFDPTGTRLAVWVSDPTDPKVGTLRLVVLDPEAGTIDASVDPLPGVAALRGVSINAGRMAWVTPPGQDGEASHIQVLGWRGNAFGQVRTIPTQRVIVIR